MSTQKKTPPLRRPDSKSLSIAMCKNGDQLMRHESQGNPMRKVGRWMPRNSHLRAKAHVSPFYGSENKFNFARNTQGVSIFSGNIPPPCRTRKCARGEHFVNKNNTSQWRLAKTMCGAYAHMCSIFSPTPMGLARFPA